MQAMFCEPNLSLIEIRCRTRERRLRKQNNRIRPELGGEEAWLFWMGQGLGG